MSLQGTETHANLKAAFAGESQANRRYLYFAKVADVEGYPDIGGLFRDTAEAETGHAHGHLDYLKRVGDPATGLSAFAYTGVDSASMVRSQTAINAQATINGIPVESASNKLEGVADGLTLTLSQVTTAAVEVTVAPDTAAVQKSIETFVSAFNDVANYIRDQTKYNPDTKVGGTLQGDRLVTSLQSQLRDIVNQGSTASSTFERLTDIGVSFTSTGRSSTRSRRICFRAPGSMTMCQRMPVRPEIIGACVAISGISSSRLRRPARSDPMIPKGPVASGTRAGNRSCAMTFIHAPPL